MIEAKLTNAFSGHTFLIKNENGVLLTIDEIGHVTIHGDVNEAAKIFWDCVEQHAGKMIDKGFQAAVNALKNEKEEKPQSHDLIDWLEENRERILK